MMRIFSKKTLLFLTAAVTSLTAAEGEYFYRFPESMLPGTGQRERLYARGDLALFSGSIPCARAVFQALDKDNPLIGKQLFEEKLLLAENETEKARCALVAQASSNSDTPESELARCMIAELLLDAGNPCGAVCCFQKLAERPKAPASWRAAARRGEVLAWIRLGDYAKADALLLKTPLEFPNAGTAFHLPELLNLSCSGRSNLLLERWKKMKEEFAPRPESILYHLLMEGAEHSAKRSEWQTAQELYGAAYHYTSTDLERMDIFRKLLNIQCKSTPERALNTIDRFLKFFPDLPDRFDLELLRGTLHYQTGHFKKAVECFKKLIENPKTSAEIQIRAAEAAAQSAEKSGDFDLARKMYESAVWRTRDAERKQDLQIELMKFLLRIKAYRDADEMAAKLEPFFGKENDELNLLRLQALTALKNYPKAEEIALRLTRSPVKQDAAEGMFQLAWITEQLGKKADARKCYQRYLKNFPRGARAPEAILAAAELALQNKEYAAAGKEFENFSQKYSRHAKAAEALLASLYAAKACGSEDGELKQIQRLYREISEKYPNSPQYDIAALLTAEAFFFAGKYTDAVRFLDKLLNRSHPSPQMQEALLLKARCLSGQKKSAEAKELLLSFLEKYPNSPLAADAALDAGRCCFRIGDYPQALRCFSRAETLAGNSLVQMSARCEAADCRLSLKSKDEVRKALEIYRELAENPHYPALGIEAAFKAGIAAGQLSRPLEALKFYEQVVGIVHRERKYLLYPGVSAWCTRAAQAALQLMMRVNLSNGFQRAIRIYKQYKDLSIPGSHAELEKYLADIRALYTLVK